MMGDGRRMMEEVRGKTEEGRGMMFDGRCKREEGRGKKVHG